MQATLRKTNQDGFWVSTVAWWKALPESGRLHWGLVLFSGLSAIHLALELVEREQVPFFLGNEIMAVVSGIAFLAAELLSISSVAVGKHTAQRFFGGATYVAMMAANGFIQTAYYGAEDSAFLHNALGWWLVFVSVGVGSQLAAALYGEEQERKAHAAKASVEKRDEEFKQKREAEEARKEAKRKGEEEEERLKRERQGEREQAEWELGMAEKRAALAQQQADAEARRNLEAQRLTANAEIQKARVEAEAYAALESATRPTAQRPAKSAPDSAAPKKPTERSVERSVVDDEESAFESARDKAFWLLEETPGISNQELAEQCSIGASTARSYRAQWNAENAQPRLALAVGD